MTLTYRETFPTRESLWAAFDARKAEGWTPDSIHLSGTGEPHAIEMSRNIEVKP